VAPAAAIGPSPATVRLPEQRSVPVLRRSDSTRRPTRANRPRTISPQGFVPIPTAIGLPDFESGQIVRFDLPITSLPLYGVQIPAGASEDPIRADLLIGQDGQARAIRLVTRDMQDTRSKQ
jgi:hypothetical protein